MSTPKILLTGATGYIGGSILAQLIKSDHPALRTITCIVRGQDRISKLKEVYGDRVKAELYEGLDDFERTIDVASQHDIVINTTLGFHEKSPIALIDGLAKRKQATGKDVFLIHTSGTSNLADRPITGDYIEDRIFDDAKDDVYGYEKDADAKEPYPQRTTELGVVDAGLKEGVKTLVVMSPTIFGVGSGEWNKSSIQVPSYVKVALSEGQSAVAGEGKGEWDHVHISDLALLYEVVLCRILDNGGDGVPFGKKGIIFSGNGRHTWGEVAQGVANAAYEAGKIKTRELKSVGLEEGAEIFVKGWGLGAEDGKQLMEQGFSSNSRTESTIARKLGWRPVKGAEAWKEGFAEEVRLATEKGSS
ncbi:hypothetical protein PRZ48_001673 [Zasmidium cellare]|uniref:Thioester reductase (TE) domain-containing protein n=1 Tax=Zasmidium cellare TaxID=395010 RepID=A0ABR0F4B8_ZASCE|nr:hypothetical protein PRZ48_001673 [Zasmidium cellare]